MAFALASMEWTPPFPYSFNFHHNLNKSKYLKAQFHATATGVQGQPTHNSTWKSQANTISIPSGENLFSDIQGSLLDSSTYASLLQTSTNVQHLNQLHAHMLRTGLYENLVLVAKLVTAYIRCHNMDNARLVFDKIDKPSVSLWNVMIRGYASNGFCEEALNLYDQMEPAGIQPDKFTFPFVLKACAGLSALQEGKKIHDHIVTTGLESDVFVGNSLINMYSKCGSLEMARLIFEKMPDKDIVSWNSIIVGYAQSGHTSEVWELFYQMQLASVSPDPVTLVSLLQACAHLANLQQGKWVHDYIIRRGFELNVCVGNSLIDMYAKCGCLDIARQVFDNMSKRDVVSWNAMISGYAQNGHANEALSLFDQMQLAGMKPNTITVVSVLQACAQLKALQQGKWIHDYIIRCGLVTENFAWSAMITGYAQTGHANEALTLFYQMQLEQVTPDLITLASVLTACAQLAALQQGKGIHGYVVRSAVKADVFVGTALIDMYAKCGTVDIARNVFDKMSKRNVVSWSAMIAGYGMHGQGEEALELFTKMQQTGVKPDYITFVSVLSACSHAGMVNEGWQYFDCMVHDYCITPREEHYACMVDLLGRAGCLDEALDFIKKMPLEPGIRVWGALLGACRIHCNIELGERVAKHIFELEPKNAGLYVLLSNIYAAAGRWDDVANVRSMMKYRGLKKEPGCSLIEVNKKVHAFLVGDTDEGGGLCA